MNLPGNKVLAVIVTYCPDEEFRQSILQLQGQVDQILVVDNSPHSQYWNLLEKLKSEFSFELIINGFNLGIASALNRGVQYAQRNHFQWLLTLDDDSHLPPQFVETLLRTYHMSPEKDRIAILAPTHFDKATGYQSRDYKSLKGPYVSKDIVMTSGTLIPMWVFN